MITLDRILLLELELDYDQLTKLPDQDRKKALKAAYHRLAQKYHPDKWREDCGMTLKEMEERFKRVHHSYQAMTDPTYRNQIANKKQVNLSAVINISLTFIQAFFGSETVITFNPAHINDNGEVITPDFTKDIHMEVDVIRVEVPPCTRQGDKLIIPRRGLIQGDRRGDMVFIFNISPHDKFSLHQEDDHHLLSYEHIPLELMLAGGELEVETIWGIKTTKVPPGTQPGDSVTIDKLGPKRIGKHTVHLDMVFPSKDDVKKSKIWKKLDIKWEEGVNEESLVKKEEEFEAIFQRLGGFKVPTSSPRFGSDETEF